MGAVMVRCPQTGRDVPTGLVTDRKSFESMPVFFARVHCPICRTEHEWFAKEAWCARPSHASRARPCFNFLLRPRSLTPHHHSSSAEAIPPT